MLRVKQHLLDIADQDALRVRLGGLAKTSGNDDALLREHMILLLTQTLKAGRQLCRERLEGGRYKGQDCAAALSYLQDVVTRSLFDFVLTFVYPVTNPTRSEKLAVLAVGGYGRGTMAPGSDVDLLFLLPYKQTPWGESVVEYMLYSLWDMGLKVGHATRTVKESLTLSRQDMTIRTSILEARYLAGDRPLFDELEERFFREVTVRTGNEFVEVKLAEQDARHERTGRSRYLVEPNVKDGKGGQRDIHTMFWIAKYLYQLKQPEELVRAGIFTRDEFRRLRKADNFLWAVRCELHFLTGRPEERITFDLQMELARLLGYHDHAGLRGVERFMKHYFLVAKNLGELTRVLCAVLEEQEKKKKPGIGRFMSVLRRRHKEVEGFKVEQGRLSVQDGDFFAGNPVNMIRIFHVADTHGLLIHPDAHKQMSQSLRLVNKELRKNKEANRLFLEILVSGNNPERALRKMNEAGILGRFITDFGRIVALMQFNMYHHYTADEHLIRAVGILSDIEKGKLREEHPLATELCASLKSRKVLYMAVLLHDIAKGRLEDHSVAGGKIARKLCPRLGMGVAETEMVTWLVEHHLVMSDVAQKRDLSDPRTVKDFAGFVQSPERLKLLEVLTEVDIHAVGPGTWNGWKAQLLRQLYSETKALLTGDVSVDRAGRIEREKKRLAEKLADWPKAKLRRALTRHEDAYWLSFPPDSYVRHARMMDGAREEELTVSAQADQKREATGITLYAPDHPGLFSRFAGACAAAGANILEARIFTTVDGMALDTLWVQDFEGVQGTGVHPGTQKSRMKRLEVTIRKVLAGEILVADAIEDRNRRRQRIDAFSIEPQIFIDNTSSENHTLIEVNGLDRPGLLHALTRTLFHLGLTISSAQVVTFGERAADVFYVRDLVGQKIKNANKQKAVERKLTEALKDPVRNVRPRKRKADKTEDA